MVVYGVLVYRRDRIFMVYFVKEVIGFQIIFDCKDNVWGNNDRKQIKRVWWICLMIILIGGICELVWRGNVF